MTVEVRPPEFLIVGTMKSGTTTLFRWLERHPDTALPGMKEPNFFTDNNWRGSDWYWKTFPPRANGVMSGEASVSYSAPDNAETAARRIRDSLPDVKLICVVRHPLERARSHYRHQVQRRRERRSFEVAMRDLSSVYVRYSMYGTCLKPFLENFELGQQLKIIRFEDLVYEPHAAWYSTLDFLGLKEADALGTAHNVSVTKSQFTTLMRVTWHREWARWAAKNAPAQLRRMARRLFLTSSSTFKGLVSSSRSTPFPSTAGSVIWSDVKTLEEAANNGVPMWMR